MASRKNVLDVLLAQIHDSLTLFDRATSDRLYDPVAVPLRGFQWIGQAYSKLSKLISFYG